MEKKIFVKVRYRASDDKFVVTVRRRGYRRDEWRDLDTIEGPDMRAMLGESDNARCCELWAAKENPYHEEHYQRYEAEQ